MWVSYQLCFANQPLTIGWAHLLLTEVVVVPSLCLILDSCRRPERVQVFYAHMSSNISECCWFRSFFNILTCITLKSAIPEVLIISASLPESFRMEQLRFLAIDLKHLSLPNLLVLIDGPIRSQVHHW